MDKQQALQNVEDIFHEKEATLYRMESAVAAVTAAKVALKVDKDRVANMSYKAVDEAMVEEREARLKLSLVDNTIHMLALIAKINCEWSIEREPVDDLPLPF